MSRVLITCGTITSSLTYMELNSQKERKERLGQKIFNIYKIFYSWNSSCNKSHLPPSSCSVHFLGILQPLLSNRKLPPLVIVGKELPENALDFSPLSPFLCYFLSCSSSLTHLIILTELLF